MVPILPVCKASSPELTDIQKFVPSVVVREKEDRAFAAGDRVQSTAPDRARDIANRELGGVERIDPNGRMEIRWDSGRTSSFESGERRHLDYGYSVTSHGSQGQTAGRVLVHVETERAGEKLVNQRLAYVAVSRGQYDARIYTDDKAGSRRVASICSGENAGASIATTCEQRDLAE